jgi:signal transduction histidine kinase
MFDAKRGLKSQRPACNFSRLQRLPAKQFCQRNKNRVPRLRQFLNLPQAQRDIVRLALLLENAGKYSEEKTEVKVEASQQDKTVTIKVCNQGIGIPDGERENVFLRFYRVTDKKVQREIGSGLGLAIARDLAKELGGELRLLSGETKNTIFAIEVKK